MVHKSKEPKLILWGPSFCFLGRKTSIDSVEILQTIFKDETIGEPQAFEWFLSFKMIKEISINDEPRSGRLSTVRTDKNVEQTGEIIREDQ